MRDRYSRRDIPFDDDFSDRQGGNERGRYPEHTRGYGGGNLGGGGRSSNYFGAGRMGYGDGLPGDDFGNFGSTWRHSGYPDRENDRADRGEMDRSAFRGGSGRDFRDRSYGDRFGGSSRYGSSAPDRFERRSNEYPSSEEGYRTGNDDRTWWDRATDEVSSWFGDDEAERRRRMDTLRSGSHYGRGPKNYTRSDDRIKEDINDRLTDDYSVDASDIDVAVDKGEVTLSGTVNSRYEKRAAEDIAEYVSGVRNVENRLRVSETRYGSTGVHTFEQDTSKGGLSGSTGENQSSAANGGI